ncbi:GNAT family N-acetyltransferase [Pedobacter lusitanus]|uniref:GNAT family N-acetyltransferase n=1 Tax=Pedobacter lusitanus TaxID=1503925 RepID=UPI00069665A1|nr:GNAT family N-acetyltransferase [Pedobacter lusitanus]
MVNTERLVIQPLTFSQLKKYILADGSLEEELKTKHIPRVISAELKDALEHTIFPAMESGYQNYLYSTLWTIITKDCNHIIGDLCFIGEPNYEGEIEIGYGTYERFQGKGYMKEAISGMIAWAAEQDKVKSIIAHTLKSNQASYMLLIKNNFRQIDEMEFLYKWEIRLKDQVSKETWLRPTS